MGIWPSFSLSLSSTNECRKCLDWRKISSIWNVDIYKWTSLNQFCVCLIWMWVISWIYKDSTYTYNSKLISEPHCIFVSSISPRRKAACLDKTTQRHGSHNGRKYFKKHNDTLKADYFPTVPLEFMVMEE
jgi:hypothetical protein